MLVNIKEIPKQLNDKWLELQKDFYVCYGVKELAYKVGYDLRDKIYELNNIIKLKNDDYTIYHRFYNNKHKIMFPLLIVKDKFNKDRVLYICYDIYWATGVFGDCGLHITNGKLKTRVPQGYQDIEYALEDEEVE